MLNFLQNEHLNMGSLLVKVRYNPDGSIKEKYVTKKSIIEHYKNLGQPINKEFIRELSKKHPDIFKQFKKEKHEYNEPFDKDDFSLVNIIDQIIKKLSNLPTGSDYYRDYEKLIVGVTELIFYPDLLKPKSQKRVNDGRKIIDIVFSNRADKGIFRRLIDVYRLIVPSVLIECKNYTKDIQNPELDQMIGRFSNTRGNFGIIFCRGLNNSKKFISREKDTYKDGHGLILHVTDSELIELLNNMKHRKNRCYEELISSKCDEVVIG